MRRVLAFLRGLEITAPSSEAFDADLKAHAAETYRRERKRALEAEQRRDFRALGAARKRQSEALHEILRLGS